MRIDRVKLATEMARADVGVCVLAEKACITRATIAAIKKGKNVREETGVKLATALGVPLDALRQQ